MAATIYIALFASGCANSRSPVSASYSTCAENALSGDIGLDIVRLRILPDPSDYGIEIEIAARNNTSMIIDIDLEHRQGVGVASQLNWWNTTKQCRDEMTVPENWNPGSGRWPKQHSESQRPLDRIVVVSSAPARFSSASDGDVLFYSGNAYVSILMRKEEDVEYTHKILMVPMSGFVKAEIQQSAQ